MNKALIDTDIISYFLKGDQSVARKIVEYSREHGKLSISIITYYEIAGGLEYKLATRQKEKFEAFVDNHCEIINLSKESIKISAEEYGRLRRDGITIGSADLFIAGIAIQKGYDLITNNIRHYQVIDGLRIVNWKV
ncbi:MAG: type II toxin-antitoxin system VapC family toxin [Lewinellaceae bacterium]|nr:type II toxin-antitoxin system VapC family toxin [Lewinellaceae bacterium]